MNESSNFSLQPEKITNLAFKSTTNQHIKFLRGYQIDLNSYIPMQMKGRTGNVELFNVDKVSNLKCYANGMDKAETKKKIAEDQKVADSFIQVSIDDQSYLFQLMRDTYEEIANIQETDCFF